MSFWDHLSELRRRIVFSLIAVGVTTCFAYFFRDWLYWVLVHPLMVVEPELRLNFFSPQESFIVTLRIALCAGIVLASPIVLWQLWAFVAPALKREEKRVVQPILPVVISLFVLGVVFVYYMLLPASLKFLIGFAPDQLEAELQLERYIGFATALCLSGGLLFELPAVLGLLGYLGIVSARWLWQRTGYALVVLMLLAALITPTGDAFNMLALTAPLVVLYLLSILVVWLIQRARLNKTTPDRV